MATSSSTTSSNGSSASRWAGLADPGPRNGSFSRGAGRGRGNARGGRGGRGGGKGPGGPVREAVKLEASQEKPKLSLAKPAAATAPIEPSERTPSTPKSRNPSRRLSRSIPAPIATQLSTPPTELPTPTPRPSNLNRRRRSQVGKGPASTSKPTPDDNSAKKDKSLLAPIPPTAPSPARDSPPQVVIDHSDDRSPAEMRTNIDALVEHVRAVAMAENRPTTPGSHIDWAGDDDDSLPDLNDWGIPTLAASQTISPIIVGGLKPLPEPVTKPLASQSSVKDPSPLARDAPGSRTNCQAERENKPPVAPSKRERNVPVRRAPGWDLKSLHPSLPNRPGARNAPSPNRKDSSKPAQAKNAPPEPTSPAANPEPKPPAPVTEAKKETEAAALDITITTEEALALPAVQLEVPEASTGTSQAPERKSLAGSVHAPASARDPLFGGIGDKSGLAASIHAPKSTDVTSAPATMPSYNLPPRESPVRSDGGQWGHSRRPASTNSHPRNQHPNGRGYNHARNHSSPHTSAVDGNHKQPHARPVINADAISRLARTIVSTTPKPAPAVAASSD